MTLLPYPRQIHSSEAPSAGRGITGYFLLLPARDERLEAALFSVVGKYPTVLLGSDGYCITTEKEPVCNTDAAIEDILQEHLQGYHLIAREGFFYLRAHSAAGIYYGLQTYRQLLRQPADRQQHEIVDYPEVKRRAMYFDLRQTHPDFPALLKSIAELAAQKYNCLIVEYEDKFPYITHPQLRHKTHCLSDRQLQQLLDTARQHFVEVIPLQQSFGHLEYVLRQDDFSHLRETPGDLGEICPCKEEAYRLVCRLIDEMLDKHPDSTYLHLGCDEVWSLCSCPACTAAADSREELFIRYVNRLIAYVCDKGRKPIIWHDMLMHCTPGALARLDNRVMVMVWEYQASGITCAQRVLIQQLQQLGFAVSGAGAVRCHDGRDLQNLPVIGNRLQNLRAWAVTAGEQQLDFLVATNWSTAFTYGAPYGIYETALYPLAYAAECFWSGQPGDADFAQRYLAIVHQLPGHSCEVGAYYTHLARYAEALQQPLAKHIALMLQLDTAFDELAKLNAYLFRATLFARDSGNRTALVSRIRKCVAQTEQLREPVQQSLAHFLPPDMAELYYHSRYDFFDFINRAYYQIVLEQFGDNGSSK